MLPALICLALVAAQTAAVATAEPSVGQIKAQIKTLKNNSELKPATRKLAIKIYEQAISQLQTAQQYSQSAAEYHKVLEQAPQKIGKLKKQSKPAAHINKAALMRLPLDQLEKKLSQARAKLSANKAKLSSLKKRIQDMQGEPEAIQQKLEQQKTKSNAPQFLSHAPVPAAVANARLALHKAQRTALAQQINMLQQKLLSHNARLNTLQMKRAQLQEKVDEEARKVSFLQQLGHSRRSVQAHQLIAAAREAQEATQGQPSTLPELAKENTKLGEKVAALASQMAKTRLNDQKLGDKTKRLNKNFQTIKAELNVPGMGHVLGDVLRRQRDTLPEASELQTSLRHLKTEIAHARLAQYHIEQEQDQLAQEKQDAEKQLKNQHDLTEEQISQARDKLNGLISNRGKLLEHLNKTYTQYINKLQGLAQHQSQLLEVTKEFRKLLNENLLWLPSAKPAGKSWVKNIEQGLNWLLSAKNWSNTASVLHQGFKKKTWLAVALAVTALMLWLARGPLRKLLESRARHIGKVRRDRFLFTIEGLGISILLAVPVALLFAVAGILLIKAPNSPDFAAGVGHGLANMALLILFFESFRHFCRDKGVAHLHFRWPEESRRILMRNFWWLLILELPLALLISLANHSDAIYRNGLGRAAFVIASFALSVFLWRILRPRRGAIPTFMYLKKGFWTRLLRFVGYPLALLIPLFLAGIALGGYYFTALMLETRVYYSAWLFVGIVISVGLVLRGLNVAGRRLAFARALAKREAALAERASRESDETASDVIPENVDVPEIDLETVNEQTRKLLGLCVVLAVGAGLFLIWNNVLPALNGLDSIQLWAIHIGNKTAEHITLQDLLLAAVVFFFTIAAGRNLPGLMEISLLQRFEVASGNRYAITTISRYLISLIGLLAALNLIGISWKQAQCLVAALGVGLGFGLQEIFANFVSGLIILFERPIRLGDTVTVGNQFGTVSRIRIRATTIIDWDRKELIVPNRTFITQEVTNWTLTNATQRVVFPIGIDYASDPNKATEIMMEVVQANSRALEDPAPMVLFMGYSGSTLNFQIRAYINGLDDWLPLIHEVNGEIHRALREAGIKLAFPQQDMHVRSWEAPVPWKRKNDDGAQHGEYHNKQEK